MSNISNLEDYRIPTPKHRKLESYQYLSKMGHYYSLSLTL